MKYGLLNIIKGDFMIENTTIRGSFNQETILRAFSENNTNKTVIQTMFDKVRNIDLSYLKNCSLVKRAYNLGWKTPAIITAGLVFTYCFGKYLHNKQQACGDIHFEKD